MVGFAEVRFKGTRKGYFSYGEIDLRPGSHVIVEADRGEDIVVTGMSGNKLEKEKLSKRF